MSLYRRSFFLPDFGRFLSFSSLRNSFTLSTNIDSQGSLCLPPASRCKVLALYRLSAYGVFCQCKLVLAVEQANESQRSGRFDEEVGHPTEVYLCFDPMCSALLVLQPYGSMYGSCIPVMGSMLLCSGSSPEKHASLSSLFHQYRPAEPPQKSMLLCPSSISTAQRRLPIEKHTSLLLFHQNRVAEAPQKSIHL